MYLPNTFAEARTEVLHELLRAHPLGTVVRLAEGELQADHIPFLLRVDESGQAVLRAHVARANPLWQQLSQTQELLVVFQGPQTYITPNWYATKREHGKVVPTWNYMVAHAYGPLKVMDDPVWVRELLTSLTDHFEAREPRPWQVSDAPEDFINQLLNVIVGIEIPVRRLTGKWKISQNQPRINRESVLAGLREKGDEAARAMATAMERSEAVRPPRRVNQSES